MSSSIDCKTNFICQHCGKRFRSKQSLNNHINFKHDITCSYCNKGFPSKYYLKLHEDSAHNSVTFTCKQCSRTFKSKYYMNIHIHEVHTGVSYDCVECLLPFKSRYSLQAHVDRVHNVLTYNCEVCSQTFKSRYLLKVHIDQTHIGMTYNCEQCSKIFKSKYLLRVHTEEIHKCVAYNCELCLKSFKSKYYLMQHISKKHNGGNFGMVHDAKNLSTNAMKSIFSRNIGSQSGPFRQTVTKPKPFATSSVGSQSKTSAIKPCEILLTDSVTSRARAVVQEGFGIGETECESRGDIANHTEPSRDMATESHPLNSIIKSSIEDFEMQQQVKPESFRDIDFGQLLF